ncbi:MAG TPA: preprotein translocase subunit SecY, partial [Gemmatimonadales bacterium]|nr:preprotein translocase subunit SecY [Gemmatimonadales bacterium]
MSAPRIPNLFRDPELKDKLLFTLLCLAVYRAGAHIATPGVNVQVLTNFAKNSSQTLFGIYDLFTGGGLSKATVLALGIMPYISASIIFQLGQAVFPYIDKLQKEEDGRKKITQWTRYVTVALSIGQAYGFAIFTESLAGAVAHPGYGFRMMTVLTLTTGSIFVMWLGEQITERGIGNGMSLMIFFSIMDRAWPGFFQTISFFKEGILTSFKLVVLVAVMVGVVAAVIAITIAARRIPIQIPRKVMGRGRIREGQKTFIPIRINTAGVMPIIFAQSLIIVPGTL